MTNPEFQELLKDSLKKYFKKEIFNNFSKETIDKFVTVNPSINNFDIVNEYNKTLSKKDTAEYTLSRDKEIKDELTTLKKEKKEVTSEMKNSNSSSKENSKSSSKENSKSSKEYSKSSKKYK